MILSCIRFALPGPTWICRFNALLIGGNTFSKNHLVESSGCAARLGFAQGLCGAGVMRNEKVGMGGAKVRGGARIRVLGRENSRFARCEVVGAGMTGSTAEGLET